jgi:hypothetical protein
MPFTLPGSMKFARSVWDEVLAEILLGWKGENGRKGEGERTSVLIYLHGAQHGYIYPSRSNHAERFMAAER